MSKLPTGSNRVITEYDTPEDFNYTPPNGAPILDPIKEGMFYTPEAASREKDKLQPFERKYIIPLAMNVAGVFDLSPIPEDIYKQLPDQSKGTEMFCVINRSGIRQESNKLTWESILLVIKKFLVIRIVTELDLSTNIIKPKYMWLWSRQAQRYEKIEDPQLPYISERVIPAVLEQYKKIEGIC